MAKTVYKVSKITIVGQCPGGEYKDNMGKMLPCMRKTLKLDINSPAILTDTDTGFKYAHCPRCFSKITLSECYDESSEIVCLEPVKDIDS